MNFFPKADTIPLFISLHRSLSALTHSQDHVPEALLVINYICAYTHTHTHTHAHMKSTGRYINIGVCINLWAPLAHIHILHIFPSHTCSNTQNQIPTIPRSDSEIGCSENIALHVGALQH